MGFMRKLLFILLLTAPFLVSASHIVGGEFELIYISGNSYRLNLVLYFDVHNGLPGAKDLNINARIFRTLDNAIMRDVSLPLTSETPVTYSQPECSIGELITSRLIYTTIIVLGPNDFNDPLGYYITWQRCCRNYSIDNIYSDDPNSVLDNPTTFGLHAGQTFYLEIPPVVKNGQPFINSSPRLFPPLSDYACKGKPYYVDFGGTDDDGDSLVYSLVEPLNTITANALPPGNFPLPKPFGSSYPTVSWRPGFSLSSVMGGAPDLAVSDEGFLTVTPKQTGLFVFAVKCEEFRSGVKIGETRRDFQMLTVDCKISVPPVIKGKKIGDTNFTYRENMNITFPHSISAAERCIEVQVSDDDFSDAAGEKVKIRARAIGDKKNIDEVKLPAIKAATLTSANGIATFKICFDECPISPNKPYIIQIIVSDDACALPLLDTLRITVMVQTPPNSPVQFIEPNSDLVSAGLKEGDPKKLWPIKVVDPDGDSLTVTYKTDGFLLPNVGMDLDFTQPVKGRVSDTLIWDPQCDKYDFSVKRNFNIVVYADDKDFCSYNKKDSIRFKLALIPPPNKDPIIDTDITPIYSERKVDGGVHRIFERIDFNVYGHDDDAGYPISFVAQGIDFKMADYKIDFPLASGNSDIASHFSWPLECNISDLSKKNSFNIRFIVVDKNNKCKIYQADTVDVALKILPPTNALPKITLQNLHPETNIGPDEASTFWDKPVALLLTGEDSDKAPVDNIKMELVSATGNVEPVGYSFAPVSGQKEIQSKFIWTPDCSVFQDDIFLNTYEFKFRVYDDRCQTAAADTVTFTLNVEDYIHTDETFLPASIITANGDNYNPYFALEGYDLRADGTNPDADVNLPLDNCLNKFENISIYNRWGKLVFTSNNRFFRWHAPDAAPGVYFYLIKFTNKAYKGSVLIRN